MGYRVVHPSADVDPAKKPRKVKDAGAEIRGFCWGVGSARARGLKPRLCALGWSLGQYFSESVCNLSFGCRGPPDFFKLGWFLQLPSRFRPT